MTYLATGTIPSYPAAPDHEDDEPITVRVWAATREAAEARVREICREGSAVEAESVREAGVEQRL